MIRNRPDATWLFADPDHGPINVNLSKFERRVAKNLATARQNWCVKNYVQDQKKAASLDGVMITIEGTAAEIAVAKALNLYLDMSVGQFSKFDLVLASGLRADVKQSKRQNGNLAVKASTKRNGTDLFILVLGSGYSFQVWGYAWAGDLLDPGNLAQWLPVPGFFLRRADLLDPRDLLDPNPAKIRARRLALKAVEAAKAQARPAGLPHFSLA